MPSTSLPPLAPMTNGVHKMVNGEADVSLSFPTAYPTSHSPSLEDVSALLHGQVDAFLKAEPEDEVTRRTQEQTRISMQVIEKALLDYEFSALSLSYNGGKDCLVLLILYLAVLHTHFSAKRVKNGTHKPGAFPKSIPSIYAKPPDPFPAVSRFVDYSSRLYHLNLTHISTNPGPRRREKSHSNPPVMTQLIANTITEPNHTPLSPVISNSDRPTISFRDAFALYLTSHPSVRAIFVGTRRTDPHGGHLTHFDATDHNWPDFMRVHPVIDWHLSEIWCFLRSPYLTDLGELKAVENGEGEANGDGNTDGFGRGRGGLRYCAMYDEGYTSLGGVNDTVRNPKLRYIDGDGRERFKPAYEMTWDEGERLGRE